MRPRSTSPRTASARVRSRNCAALRSSRRSPARGEPHERPGRDPRQLLSRFTPRSARGEDRTQFAASSRRPARTRSTHPLQGASSATAPQPAGDQTLKASLMNDLGALLANPCRASAPEAAVAKIAPSSQRAREARRDPQLAPTSRASSSNSAAAGNRARRRRQTPTRFKRLNHRSADSRNEPPVSAAAGGGGRGLVPWRRACRGAPPGR